MLVVRNASRPKRSKFHMTQICALFLSHVSNVTMWLQSYHVPFTSGNHPSQFKLSRLYKKFFVGDNFSKLFKRANLPAKMYGLKDT